MSRDTKASCIDCQGHAEVSAFPFASPFPVDVIRDELNEPERSVRPVSSFVATTCASDTDEGDYETSSEGMILSKRSGNRNHGAQVKESLRVYLKEKSTSLSKRSVFDGKVSTIKRGVISDPPHELTKNRLTQKTTYVRDSFILMSENLAQSKSLPIMKSDIPSDVSTDFTATDVALTSASSSACKKKMSMIIKRMAPLISSYSSTVSLTTGATTNFRDRRYETKRLVSRTMLPIFCDTTVINDGRSEELVAEVTLHETKNNRRAMNWDPRRDAIPTFVNDESAANATNDDDLVDIARNPYSSIKSVYFPPNFSDPLALPYDSGKSKRQRVATDVETLLKIDHELGPLRYQYSQIIGKARTLGLSDTGFDLGISCRLNQPDTFDQSVLSPSISNYFPNRGQTYLRQTTINSGIENRSAVVDKTSPTSTFSVVGKLTPRCSRTSWLNENGSNRRQEALSFAIRDPFRILENSDDSQSFPRDPNRVRNSVSYFPTTNSHTFHGENVLHDRPCNGCVSNSDFHPYRKSKTVTERVTSALDYGLYARETVNTNPSNIFSRTEYNSHRYLNRIVKNLRTSTSNSFGIQRRRSSVSIVEVIDNNWSTVDEGTGNKRSNEHFEIPSDNRNSMVVETEFASRGSNYHKSILPETERVTKDDRISSSFALKSIDPGVESDREVPRTVSVSAGVPQIRVVSVNTEFRATIEKHCTSRAVSPIQHSRSVTASMSPSNVLLAKVSSIFVQQVHADSTREVAKVESPAKICSHNTNKRDVLADAVSKRDFCVQKVDSRLVTENLLKFPGFKRRDEADLTTAEFRKAQYLRLPRTKEKITIVPIVVTDGISEPSGSADVDFAIPKYAVKMVPKLNYQLAPSFDARKFRGTSSSSIRDNESYQRDIADPMRLTEEFANEKRRRANRASVSHVNRHPCAKHYSLLTTMSVTGNPKQPTRITSNARVVRKAREYRDSSRQTVAKMISGMRSTPEDFLCET